MGVNKRVKVTRNYARGSKAKVKKLLIKFIKFIAISLKFKWNFFNS